MKEFITSDTHWGHENIIEYTNRPFSSVQEMNEALVSNWNKVVGQDDHVFVLGDVCMGQLDESIKYLWRLNGKLFLIVGNHDKKSLKMKRFTDRFEWIKDYYEHATQIDGQGAHFVMFHFPIASWHKAHRGSFHVHGHSHGSYTPGLPHTLNGGKILDVGTDVHNYTPISLKQVAKIMEKKTFIKTDGHESRDM